MDDSNIEFCEVDIEKGGFISPLPLSKKRSVSEPAFNSNDKLSPEAVDRTPSILRRKKLPEWVKTTHIIFTLIILLFLIGGLICFAIYPYTFYGNKDEQELEKQFDIELIFGFRNVLLLLHCIINITIFTLPYIIWFKNKCKIKNYSQKELAPSERTLYYSYSIADGLGHQVATLGVAISSIIFALVILFRFDILKSVPKWTYDHQSKTVNMEKYPKEVENAIITNLILGLFSRIFAAGVPSFPVTKNPKCHYFFTLAMFLTIGVYFILETLVIDNNLPQQLKSYNKMETMFRRLLCGFYWFLFFTTLVFHKAKLFMFSSLGEVSCLLANELYFMTYITSFKIADTESSFFKFEYPKK